MAGHRVEADDQLFGYLRIALAQGNQAKHFHSPIQPSHGHREQSQQRINGQGPGQMHMSREICLIWEIPGRDIRAE